MTENILIVDDEPDLELLMTQRFRKAIRLGQYNLHFARSGFEALDKIIANPNIGVVITDINMPLMTGLELLQRIKDMQNPAIKVVIVSAYGDMNNIRCSMNNGAFDFLTKPIDMNDLEQTIQKTVEIVRLIKEGLDSSAKLADYNRELDAAREIQQAILPKEFTMASDIKSIDIYGKMEAAKMVGGDFFDYFNIGTDKIGFVIGDVSGKGIPSAIFMAVARTLIRSYGITGISTAECLRIANGALCMESIDSMFVTAFYGILDINTGEIKFCNAGHNYPYVLKKDGSVTQLNNESNIILGIFEESKYNEHTFRLAPGESILLYTDGVNEAMDAEHRLLGYEAFQIHLNTMKDKRSPETITNSIFEMVHNYESNVEQSDDIAVLAVTYVGNNQSLI